MKTDQEILKKLEQMFKASKRLKIEDVCGILGMERADLLGKFFDWSDKFGFKIDGDYLVIENFILEKPKQPHWERDDSWKDEFELD